MSSTVPNQPNMVHGLIAKSSCRGSMYCGVFLWRQGRLKELTSGAGEKYLGTGAEMTADQVDPALRAVLSEEPGCGKDLVLSTPGGTKMHLNACTVPLDDGLLMVVHDAVAARQLDGNLEHLDRLASLGAMSAGMAHEIKNALVAGKTFVDLLLEKQPEAELAQVVRRELKRIESMVGQMLRHARPSPTMATSYSAHEALAQALQLVQNQFEEKSIQLRTSLSAPAHRVRGNGFQLQQALLNLLLNAAEASPQHGVLEVTTRNDSTNSGDLLISVQDEGPGVPMEALQNLFTPFYTTKPDGTGLGLVITQRIVEEHGGTVSVRSETGRGAQFIVRLPVHTGK